ncbi:MULTISPECIES: alpha/beta hydrolase [unclassified Natrinema]|uniref:alpha/beta hydrolase n=1 Tax=unclassified Natrinema TaxID=2622230 RepID=UPI0006776EC8|nr:MULTISPECIES: alpha/beta hydrolase [unclassified Natrinema]
MRKDTKGEDGREQETRSNEPTRRQLLRATSTVAASVTGLTAISGSAFGGELKDCTNWPTAPVEFPRVDLTQESPQIGGPSEDEFCLYVHGWKGRARSDDQAYVLERALQNAGYHAPVITASWASDTLNFWAAEDTADDAGVRLGRWFREAFQRDSGTTIRVVGHSLGVRVILGALTELDGDVVLDTVALLGAAVEDDSVCDDGRYAAGIRTSATAVYSYRSEKDGTICTIYDVTTIKDGLGCGGADCRGWWDSGSTPSNYRDVDVTGSVPGHCTYFEPDRPIGCMDQVVSDFG